MTGYLVMVAALLLALAVVVYDRWRIARTIWRLDDMLTAAINGSFSEKTFDESRLSALESRLGRYLAASALSERNVREQKDQISALISDISHQTKTPVANLQLYAQLLSEQPLTPQGKDCAAAISAQAEKLQALIEALVKTSRLETGILALHPQPGEIFPVVKRSAADVYKRQGLDAHLAQLREKRAILDELLARYNDGRRKTLFNTAVYLLPLEDLRAVMAILGNRPELGERPVKERAVAVVGLLQEAADRRGISLKLNKKPKKG